MTKTEDRITEEEVTAIEVWASPANQKRGLLPKEDLIKDLVLKLTAEWRRLTSNP